MSSFEWMELQSLTNDIELSRSRLAEARGRGDRGRIRALEEEITRAEKTRLQLLTHISTNIASAPEGSGAAKAKEAADSGHAAPALVAEALQVAEAMHDAEAQHQRAAALVEEPEPAGRRGRDAPPPRRAPTRVAEAAPDEAESDEPAEAAEPVRAAEPAPVAAATQAVAPAPTRTPVEAALPNEAAAARPVEPAVASAAPPAAAPNADRKGGLTVWDQLTPGDLERAKSELGARRAEVLARHAEELRGLDAEQVQLETLEMAIDSFLQKMKALQGGNTVVELRQQGNG